ncbi:MAG: C48 family peptidase [Rickettsia endosymbiont of Labidopullus appendiculatus]|nr:C48 family peptidase [Rickettsia endosymbiont of Labidopullus appendiculatus]
MPLDEGKNNVLLFNIGGSHESQETQHSTNMSNISSAISTIELKPHMQNGKLDKENIVSEIFDKAENLGKTPILNIQFNSNMEKPLFDEDDLTNLKNLGVKVCLTFSNYNAQDQNFPTSWKPLLSNVDHVFFANANDQIRAVAEKHVAKEKTSHIQSMPVSNLIESEILNRPPNILLSGGLPNKERLTEVVKAAKDLGNTRVIIASNPSSIDDVANIIANKFGIINEDQQFGIKLEVEEILQDKVGGARKLENYISQLSQQFQKDTGRTEINPIDIYFDLSDPQKLQNLAKQAKYTVPLQQGYTIENFNNGCIPLGQGQGRSSDIIVEVKQRETDPGINSGTIFDMQENLNDYKPESVLKRVINVLKQMINEDSKATSIKQDKAVHSSLEDGNLTRAEYLYNEDDISNLLKASVDQTKISVITHASLEEKELLKDTLLHARNNLIGGKEAVIIPLNTGHEHWVSLAITKDRDNKIVFTYNDPMGTPIDQRQELLDMIKEVCPDNAEIVDLKTKQQQNDKDCGPFIVDNLIKMAKGEKILTTEQSQDMGAKLREGQAETMNIEKIKKKAYGIRKTITSSASLPRPITSPAIRNNSRSRGSSCLG